MTCSDKGHFEINLLLKHNVGDPESVFTTIRVGLDGPIHIEGHLQRLIEAHASLFGSNLEIDENDILDIVSNSSGQQEPPHLVRLDIDRSERITASPRSLTKMPEEIRLSTQPLPLAQTLSESSKETGEAISKPEKWPITMEQMRPYSSTKAS